MEAFFQMAETGFDLFLRFCILFVELVGVAVLLTAIVRAALRLVASRTPGRVRLELAQGLALALEFKIGGEVLRTVIVRQWSELLILGAVIVLRAALTFLVFWEIRAEGGKSPEKSGD